MDNEYVADEAHSGTPDIYFQETYKADWAAFGGYFWMSKPNPATEAPTAAPTEAPTQAPTAAPTQAPTAAPTQAPTEAPKNYIYCNADFWKADGAKVQAYVWGDKASAKWLTATSVSNNVYTFEVPDGGYTKVIFCRMNPSGPASSWDGKWNQTEDLTIQIGKTFTVNSWNNPTGSWS